MRAVAQELRREMPTRVWCAGVCTGPGGAPGPAGWAFVSNNGTYEVPGCGMLARCDPAQAVLRAVVGALTFLDPGNVRVTLVLSLGQDLVDPRQTGEGPGGERLRAALLEAVGRHHQVSWDEVESEHGGAEAAEVVRLARAAAGRAHEQATGRALEPGWWG